MNDKQRVANGLVWLRYGVFVVMLMWTLDKFVNPGHAAGVFASFYGLPGVGPLVLYVLAGLELILLAGFVLGAYRTWTYGAVLLFHGISTLASYRQYLDPFDHLLFFAAWPMLAACYVLFVLRDLDTRWTVGD